MESFQISLQLGCLNSTTPDAFAKGRIRQGKHCLRPDCECKGTANYSLTQENHMKKYEKLFLYTKFWGVKIAKLQKHALKTPYLTPKQSRKDSPHGVHTGLTVLKIAHITSIAHIQCYNI